MVMCFVYSLPTALQQLHNSISAFVIHVIAVWERERERERERESSYRVLVNTSQMTTDTLDLTGHETPWQCHYNKMTAF